MSGAPLGWGLIGASSIGRTMCAAISADSDSRAVAVLSSSPERGRAFARELDIPAAHDSLAALLADPAVDVVYVSTTNELHHDQVLAAAAAGKHVLCEKPLALTLEDAIAMRDACATAGVVMGTNHHLRNAATHRTMHRLLGEGVIGSPLAARVFHAVSLPADLRTWRVQRPDAGGGVALDITVHDTDVLRFLLEDEVVEVSAMTTSQGLGEAGLADSIMGVMRFAGGVLASFHDAFTIAHAGTGLELHGTDGSLIAREVMTGAPVGDVFLRRGSELTAVDVGEREGLYARSVRLFSAAVRGRGAPAVSAQDGVRSLAVALAALESARSGRHVTVAPV